MYIRFSAKQIEFLADSVRKVVEEIRFYERAIMDIAIDKSGMPRTNFIKNGAQRLHQINVPLFIVSPDVVGFSNPPQF